MLNEPTNIGKTMVQQFFAGVVTALFWLNFSASTVLAVGTLRIGMESMPPGNGNPHTSGGFPPVFIWSALFDTITELDDDGALRGALAESWYIEDQLTWVFRMRDGIHFSNGESFDAIAAQETINFLLSDEGRVLSAYRELRTVDRVRARDRLTLEVKTSQPDSMIPSRFAGLRIHPPRYFEDVGPEAFALAPHGTGTFMVDTWEPGQASAVPNPYAWRPAKLDRIKFIGVTDATARTQALLSGSVDIAFNIDPSDIDQVKAAGAWINYRERKSVQMWQFITEVESPLQDKRVRQALNYAVDMEMIVRALLLGITRAATQPAARGTFGYNPNLLTYPYDPDKARSLLTEAGYPDGFSIAFQVAVPSSEKAAIYLQIVQYLKQVGVNVQLIRVPMSKQIQSIYGAPWNGKAFNMNYGSLPSLDPLSSLRFHSCLWPRPWICRADIAERALAADREFDKEKRRKIVSGLLHDLHDDPPGIIMYEEIHPDAIGKEVKTYGAPFGFVRYHTLEAKD